MKKKTQKIKRGIFVALAFGMLISNVYAIPSDGVTYDNQGNTEVLTDTLDGLLRDADKYKTGGTVTANQMLKGATGYAKGELVTGTIESKGAETYTPGTTNQTISSGVYLSGTQTIKGDANLTGANIAAGKTIFGVSGTFTSDANAAAGHILSGKTAYVNGNKITGTMVNNASKTVEVTSITQDDTYTYLKLPASGYYDTNSQVKVLNNSIGLQNPQFLQNNMVGKGDFNTVEGDNLLISYQVPQDGLYLVTGDVRLWGIADGNVYANSYLCGDVTSHATECWVSGVGSVINQWSVVHLQSTNVLQLSKGNYINFTVYTNVPTKIDGSRMHIVLLK